MTLGTEQIVGLTANCWLSGNALGSFLLWSICWPVCLKETVTSLAQMTLSGGLSELLELYFGSFHSQLPGLKQELAGTDCGEQRAHQKIFQIQRPLVMPTWQHHHRGLDVHHSHVPNTGHYTAWVSCPHSSTPSSSFGFHEGQTMTHSRWSSEVKEQGPWSSPTLAVSPEKAPSLHGCIP